MTDPKLSLQSPVWADCCQTWRESTHTSFVPEAGIYCNDGHGCGPR